ncbi:ArsR/SmtB family transcription factor [Streptomyces montanisoli]|uniref:Winged helix-turn-helix transcriptional regulator n=1 Tax=Streptomyces montanisoli TaxID=2798581 RepID=A0A940MC04_9ACTN|nr:metalloregulator ArsR/SmtB family transcription factor [Streptomyces montanisoli]MBP0456867.1 winged helix-turn-helix transcriptional regulator [Streptomyces montanisoli]
MLVLRFDADDLASVRFACSPLQETVMSLWIWQNPAKYAIHQPLVRTSGQHLSRLEWQLLQALVGTGGFLPDFLTPHPAQPRPDIRDELAAVRATDTGTVARDLANAANGRALHPRLASVADDPRGLLEEITDALEAYWRLVLEPHWPRLCAILEADVLYRARRLTDAGVQGLFNDIDRGLSWSNGALNVDEPGVDTDEDVRGRGLTFTPSLFCNRAVTLIDYSQPPRLWYPARGRGTAWGTASVPAGSALADLVGRSRAQILECVAEPMHTTELARRLGLSQGAVSQHLGVLHRAGLVDRARHGHTMLYSRSPLGDRLMR